MVSYALNSGVKINYDQAVWLREMWLKMFPEMAYHLKPMECTDEPGKYVSQTLTGRVRNRCSFCSACNADFQGLAADGAKLALWEVAKRGYQICNFIHATHPWM